MARSTGSDQLALVFPSSDVAATRPSVVAKVPGSARLGLAPRRSLAVAKSEAAESLQRFVRQEYWNDLAAGDVVRVAGHVARGRHWRFRAHVTNTSNGATWVEVALVEGPAPSRRQPADPAEVAAGGPPVVELPRVEKVRSFEPALVTARWRSRSRPRRLGRSRGGQISENSVGPGADQPRLF